ncbi:DUF1488 domain-containing protein [Franconibacter helveticus 513]|uniref:DUF1488 domain-containing protein n=1 Tax=Franconibacter helveticus TaxID=357240 RepID=UPI000467ECEC|nr:DUF1488 domain-containing protein [Franconibacter helveticus]MDU6926939.1 DUF1488 domain-containing protein [Franconibacter helveticus]
MNQAIQFPDREEWIAECQAVCFPALVNGMQVTCAITGEVLSKRYGGDTQEAWLNAFHAHRWDLEEEAEALLNAQQENDQGWLWLS